MGVPCLGRMPKFEKKKPIITNKGNKNIEILKRRKRLLSRSHSVRQVRSVCSSLHSDVDREAELRSHERTAIPTDIAEFTSC